MKILPIRSIESDTYTTVIKPSEWGTASVTAENELAMLEDTPQLLRYADIEFKDKFLKANAAFTGYDASEGALYVLFMLCLAMHPESPSMFAIDSFDHALNPRLAKRLTEIFSQLIVESHRTVFMTTHNPLVLDGLDLCSDEIRLFAVSRSKDGYVVLDRIQVSKELLELGQPLSRLWMNGRLGGVPELI